MTTEKNTEDDKFLFGKGGGFSGGFGGGGGGGGFGGGAGGGHGISGGIGGGHEIGGESEWRRGANLKMKKYSIFYVFRALLGNLRAPFSKPVIANATINVQVRRVS